MRVCCTRSGSHITRSACVTALVLGVVFGALPAGAQDLPVAEPGARLRLTIAGGRQQLRGEYMARQGDAIDFAWHDGRGDPMRQAIALRDVHRIELARGKTRPIAMTTAKGAAMGLAFGVVSAFMVGRNTCSDTACETRRDALKSYGLGLGAAGATIGLVRGIVGFDTWVLATVPGWRAPGS